MKKVLRYLATIVLCSLLATTGVHAEATNSSENELLEKQANDTTSIMKLISIREQSNQAGKPLFFMEIDVMHSSMTVYRLVENASEETFSLEEISTHRVGTPKPAKYPKGFGIITAIEKDPIWAPTDGTIEQFKKRGTDLEKFRNAQGKVIIPAGDPLNYMGPLKMRIKFLEKQASAKLQRDIYRIHGTLKKDEAKLGTRCSGGCIRTKNTELLELSKKMKGGFIVIRYV